MSSSPNSDNQDRALEAFRVATRRALMYGFDAELLEEEVAAIWRKEFEGEEDEG